MKEIKKYVRKNIRELKGYSSARSEFTGSSGIFLDANESPFGTLNRYPDPLQLQLKNVISSLKNVPVQNIFLGNGSDEAIDLCFRIFCEPGKDKALTFSPTYGMYEVAAAIQDTELIKVPLNHEFQIEMERVREYFTDERLKIIFICSPNNPTGNNMRNEDIDCILQEFDGIVIVDEAYSDFSSEKSYVEKLPLFNNLIVLQTFSKAWGLAAARTGMAFANPEIIGLLNKVKAPYNISELNQRAVKLRLADNESFKQEVATLLNERQFLVNALNEVECVTRVFPSNTNFVLIQVRDARGVYEKLITQNIVVRNRSGAIQNCLRITIGNREENTALIKALKQI